MASFGMDMEPTNGAESGGKLRLLSLDALDRRTSAAKRAIRARDALVAQAKVGGRADGVAVSLSSRAIFLDSLLEDMESRALAGEPIDQDKYLSLANCHRRAIEALGVLNTEPPIQTEESAEPIARAILSIIQEGGGDIATLIGLNSDEPVEHAASALASGEPEASSLSVSDSPNFSPPNQEPKVCNALRTFSSPAENGPQEFPNGAEILPVEIEATGERKWGVFDSVGHLHGYRRNRDAAVALARNLPTPSLDPEPQEAVTE